MSAQDILPRTGDPPVASRIRLEVDPLRSRVTITGQRNAVYPAANLVIRNLFTGEAVSTRAGITGSFVAQIGGVAGTPFWLSPVDQLDPNPTFGDRALPGGPGTIITAPLASGEAVVGSVTSIVPDGQADDWQRYEDAGISEGVRLFRNSDSLYLLLEGVAPDSPVEIELGDGSAITILGVDPGQSDDVSLRRVAPVPSNPENQRAAVAYNADESLLEIRLTLQTFPLNANQLRLRRISRSGAQDLNFEPSVMIPAISEQDGLVRPTLLVADPALEFVAGGRVEGAPWYAQGRLNQQQFVGGDTLTVELDISASLDPQTLPDAFRAELFLTPVDAASRYSNNGWSNVLTPTGLAVNNLAGDVPLAVTDLAYSQFAVRQTAVLTRFQFSAVIPDELPSGRYVPVMRAYSLRNGEPVIWEDIPARLNVLISVGEVSDVGLPWVLFFDQAANGRRGLTSIESQQDWAVAGRVRFEAGRYILPPGSYPLEPYLPNMLPNLYGDFAEPLLPLELPGGRLQVTVVRPDGTRDELPEREFLQNQLSLPVRDDASIFGQFAPSDVYRLTTLDSLYTAYQFDAYGDYEIILDVSVQDRFGNEYLGGGTYRLTIAEPLNLLPGMLPGMPFSVNDRAFWGGHVQPQIPATIEASILVVGLDGSTLVDDAITMTANRYGYFESGQQLDIFDRPGEYLFIYEARYTDSQGRLWAASVASAGVITPGDPDGLAHGRRADGDRGRFEDQAAWYRSDTGSLMPFPYFSGDVMRITEGAPTQIQPILTMQTMDVDYLAWLEAHLTEDVLTDLAVLLEELPVVSVGAEGLSTRAPALYPQDLTNRAYSYISVVKPGAAIRQLVLGGIDPSLPTAFDTNDPLNAQLGAGRGGLGLGDYAFMFGGIVVRNTELEMATTASYASSVTVSGGPEGVFPPYRGASGGADGGSVVAVPGANEALLFHSTTLSPGQVIPVGTRLPIVGNALPTLRSEVSLDMIDPEGRRIQHSAVSNDMGYLYDPAFAIDFDIPGIWSVSLRVRALGPASVGPLDLNNVYGGLPGTQDYRFEVYVVDAENESLEWGQNLADVDRSIRPGNPVNFELAIPRDWSDVAAYFSIRTPSYQIAQGALRVGAVVAIYQYDPADVQTILPAFEIAVDATGPGASDPLTLTFVMTGLDAAGQRQIRSRSFTLFHDRMISIEAD